MDDSNAILEKSRAMAREHYADLID
jgi:hypothetical protein